MVSQLKLSNITGKYNHIPLLVVLNCTHKVLVKLKLSHKK